MQHLSGLNPKQKEAALHKEGPLLIVAGAGAGKTKTITHRIVNLIKEGVAPEKILAVTFTNKAAKEMRERTIVLISEHSRNTEGENILEGTLGRSDDDGQRKFSAENFRGESENVFSGRNTSAIPFIATFHSLGVYIIKENAKLLGLTKYFTILDESSSVSLVKECLKELSIDPKQYEPKKIKGIISREKGKFTNIEDYAEKSYNLPAQAGYLSKIVAEVWALYENKKAKENSLDFDDLLLKSTKLLKDNLEIRKIYQDRWEYIHIDEYQDTNEVQYLMSHLLSENNKNICVVGDADQNIYSWRGANLKNILNFEKDYPNTKIVLLEENYRSTKNILEAANEVIKKNKYRPDKNLFTENKVGEKIGLYEAIDETDEADFVATKILEIQDKITTPPVPSLKRRGSSHPLLVEEGVGGGDKNILSDIAVLYRANFQSRVLEEAMLRYNIPYQVLGVKFFERKEIKDTLAYLRAALNPDSLSDIKRIINFPVRGIGKATIAKIFAKDMESIPIKTKIKIDNFYKILEEIKNKIETSKASDVIKFAVKKSGIENELSTGTEEDTERLENIKELATLALKYDNLEDGKGHRQGGAGVEKLLEDASLASDQDSLMINAAPTPKGVGVPTESVGIKLMTVHASKGLEFKYVFVVGLEDGLFPHERGNDRKSGEDSEEERRLFYVALTRAKEKLFLTYADFRTIFGSRQINSLSEFITDIPPDIIEKEGEKGAIKTIYI